MMEIVQILDDVNTNEWDGIIVSDEHGNQYIQDYVGLDHGHQDMMINQPQIYLLNANNTIVPLESMDNMTFFADMDAEDGEVPSHILDHMYAKKPREPGTEQSKPIRRRSKKKEQSISQVFVEELIPETPKINIIRQRLPVAQSQYKTAPTRPKILQGSHSSVSSLSNDTNYLINNPTSSLLAMATTLKASPSTIGYHLNVKSETPSPVATTTKLRTVYEDCEIPQPGEMVTITNVAKNAIRGRKHKAFSHIINTPATESSLSIVSNMKTFNEVEMDLDAIPEEEFFFDIEPESIFPVEMDVNMEDIEVKESNTVVTTSTEKFTTITFEEPQLQKVRYSRNGPHVVPESQNSLITNEGNKDYANSSDKNPIQITNLSQKKHVSWKIEPEAEECVRDVVILPCESITELQKNKNTVVTQIVDVKPVINAKVSPITSPRRSTRPVKLPARLEDLGDVSPSKKRR